MARPPSRRSEDGIPGATAACELLAVRGVTHDYGPVRALDDVSLTVQPGEVHALVGENGAGKSTLVKIVAGLIRPSAGEVLAGRQIVPAGDRAQSVAAGFGVVHQHFSLVESLTAAENYLLGRPGSPVLLPLDDARRELDVVGSNIGLEVDPDALVADLGVGQRQRLEILTALGWGAKMLLLDEPSAVLSPTEADALLDDLVRLCGQGFGFLLITHKLREVEQYADRVTVLRGGRVVGRHGRGTDRATLVAEMVGPGAEPSRATAARSLGTGPVRVSVAGLSCGRLRDLDLDLRGGEVTGVAGVVGSGQTDLIDAIAGIGRDVAGTVIVDGVDVSSDPVAAWRTGVAVIPENRERDGLAAELAIRINTVVKHQRDIGPWHRLDRSLVARICDRVIGRLDVRPAAPDLPAGRLSGGNQQRLVIGRELDRDPAVVLAAEPTRGLDPSSAAAVAERLRGVASTGAVVLVAASDLDELIGLADRLLVLCGGRVTLDVSIGDADRHQIGAAMVAEPV